MATGAVAAIKEPIITINEVTKGIPENISFENSGQRDFKGKNNTIIEIPHMGL